MPGVAVVFETHASSLDNEAGLASGWFDVGLSARGEREALALGARRTEAGAAAVCCSDLVRSWRTAEIAFQAGDVPIIRDARLRECHYGSLTRHRASEIDAKRIDHLTVPFPDGESYAQAVGRVSKWLAEAAQAFAGRTLPVVGHRATFYALEHLLRRIPLEEVIALPWRWQPSGRMRCRWTVGPAEAIESQMGVTHPYA